MQGGVLQEHDRLAVLNFAGGDHCHRLVDRSLECFDILAFFGVASVARHAAMEAIRKIRPDAYFMGVTGIHEDYGLTTGDPEEAAIKRAICELAAETIVLASSEKLGAVSPCLVAPLSDISTVLAEGRVPPKLEARLRKLKIGIVHA
jgi:DeoR/GlpR family transcriptional regulator of sugar metabolism